MRYIRRFIWYLVHKLAIFITIAFLLIFVFYYCMNAADIYIVLKDGMAKRAQVIMYDDDILQLEKYFLHDYINKDDALQLKINGKSPYSWYKIRGIDHRLSILSFWNWPWRNIATVTFEERIPNIDGHILSTYKDAIKNSDKNLLLPPKWNGGKFKATLVHENGRWLIKNIIKLSN